jgi:hypothetical protein
MTYRWVCLGLLFFSGLLAFFTRLPSITVLGTAMEEARIEVRRPRRGWDYYPFNVIVGGGVAARGVPTFLIGDAEDLDFGLRP